MCASHERMRIVGVDQMRLLRRNLSWPILLSCSVARSHACSHLRSASASVAFPRSVFLGPTGAMEGGDGGHDVEGRHVSQVGSTTPA